MCQQKMELKRMETMENPSKQQALTPTSNKVGFKNQEIGASMRGRSCVLAYLCLAFRDVNHLNLRSRPLSKNGI